MSYSHRDEAHLMHALDYEDAFPSEPDPREDDDPDQLEFLTPGSDEDYGGVLGADGQVYSDADPGL